MESTEGCLLMFISDRNQEVNFLLFCNEFHVLCDSVNADRVKSVDVKEKKNGDVRKGGKGGFRGETDGDYSSLQNTNEDLLS